MAANGQRRTGEVRFPFVLARYNPKESITIEENARGDGPYAPARRSWCPLVPYQNGF